MKLPARFGIELSTGKRVRILEETLESVVILRDGKPSGYLPKKDFKL